MHIEVNTTHQITSQETLKAEVADMVERSLNRFSDHVTTIEVHLDDENGAKGGHDDIRCTIEARLVGQQSIAVTGHAANVTLAANGASGKMARALDSAIGRHFAKQRAGVGLGHLPRTAEI
ncbi:HPF/RaiA family ribosome-associated protein [Aquabacterium sp.]|uniref:HPF/RaiA family ribosome-associated protein n=1 Tax=Aquabacterium sp. TaxID=1872578 RepID=UPI0019895152|nr:HPF/RaiA family ribosome-associated protein [Aquabacterium sp.]MBC7699146.1 ribosomal subunit interface protein [Aquabacterium sp.]